MASRYSRYDPDRRSRSPRDRSPERFDPDRRRPSVDVRSNSATFPPNRDSFGDGPRRDPPRGPRALVDPPSGPRGGFGGDFRGGRGRGRGRGWPARDDSRDRGRDRDIDFRDRYRDDRSRERDRDRDRERDRDWRDSYRARRSPPSRARSPARDFRDRDRDAPPALDLDRPRRDSRDGAGSSGLSPASDFGGLPGRGGFGRGGRTGRGGRGEWGPDRPRARAPYDDRGDRYPRSRSQEGRWGRDRDDRERRDRYLDNEPRRDPRDDRDRAGDRELFRAKMGARTPNSQDSAPPSKEVSPPPVAPSAPAFGSVPTRTDGPAGPAGTGKPPPTAPRAFGERPGLGQEVPSAPAGPSKPAIPGESPSIPVGPRAQQQKPPRPSSKQWINPNMKKAPDSPKMMRAQSFNQQRPGMPSNDSMQSDHPTDEKRPQSSDSKAGHDYMDDAIRRRSTQSAEPGEIMTRSEHTSPVKAEPSDKRPVLSSLEQTDATKTDDGLQPPASGSKETSSRRRQHPAAKTVRFAVPPKPQQPTDPASESDDDEDMADYFNMQIEKAEAELGKLHKPKLPLDVVPRFASMSHGAMVKILNEGEGLVEMLGQDIPQDAIMSTQAKVPSPQPVDQNSARDSNTNDDNLPTDEPNEVLPQVPKAQAEEEPKLSDVPPKPEDMEIDSTNALEVPTISTTGPDPSERPRRAVSAKPTTDSTPADDGAPSTTGQATLDPVEPMETTEDGSKPPSTPSQVEDDGEDETASEDEVYVDVETVRQFMTTPPVDALPTIDTQPWDQDSEFLATLDADATMDEYVLDHLQKVHLENSSEQEQYQKIYAENYTRYLKFTLSDDPVASKTRDKHIVPGPLPDPVITVPPEPKPEGRSGRRFASERDLERVLQASMREEDERREREERIQKEKHRGDKEAVIPNMYWNEEEKKEVHFIDDSGFVPPNRLVSAWQVLPPVNNFTEEEAELFEKRYLELPKQWGKIAEAVPKRSFGTCIQYYYLMKKDLNLKEKLRRQPKRRKKGGRGKQRSSALVSELGNGEPEGEENNEAGENGESRRRPRRAAAPTWGFEQPTADSESGTPASTPGRRAASAAKGDQPEKVDGRRGRRKGPKDKDAKAAKPNQTLAAATPTPTTARSRGRGDKTPNVEFQPAVPGDAQRLPTHFEQQPPSIQPAFPASQPHPQPPLQALDRPQPLAATSSMADVMAAPPLRPEPPSLPQPAMTTFNVAQTQPERKAQAQASSYWSVSESNDFPHLLMSFGSDWTAIASHMGSKTAVMVKNYYVRQKDSGKSDWEAIIRDADAKRARGEKRPDPPQPSTGGRGRRYDSSAAGASRPLAAAPGAMDLAAEPGQVKREPTRAPGYPGYGVPIAQAPSAQVPANPKSLSMQPQPQHPRAMAESMSPATAPLRDPIPFGLTDREQEQAPRDQLPQKGVPDIVRQMTQPVHPTPEEAQRLEMLHLQQRNRERDMERERERELAQRQAMRAKQEPDMVPQRPFETYGHHRQPSYPPRGDPSRNDPLSLSRHPQEPPRHGPPQPYPNTPATTSAQPFRSILTDTQPARSPPPLGPATSRPMSALQQRHTSGPGPDIYRSSTPQASTPAPAPAAPRPPEPRKSNIMSLLNDDTAPAPKRVSDVSTTSVGPSSTPPPQGIGRAPPPVQPQGASHLRREPEPQYSPYGRPPSTTAAAMPSLKPTYSASPGPGSRSSLGMPVDSPSSDREYYRQQPYPPPATHPSSGTDSPRAGHRYAPPPPPAGQSQYQPQSGYPTPYSSASQPPVHASSPPPPFSLHGSGSRSREPPPQSGREPWTTSSMQQPGGWSQPGKSSQPPPAPPSQSWAGQHGAGTPKAGTPTSWASAPPPRHGLRDERGPPVYGSQPPASHQMQSRYPPPQPSRAPEPGPPPAQPYPPRYSTPGPGQPRDPRDMPPARSYTPGGYDARGPPPPPGPGQGYPGADPRDMQLRDGRDPRDIRDPRDMIARGLRPQDYERHPDPYGR